MGKWYLIHYFMVALSQVRIEYPLRIISNLKNKKMFLLTFIQYLLNPPSAFQGNRFSKAWKATKAVHFDDLDDC